MMKDPTMSHFEGNLYSYQNLIEYYTTLHVAKFIHT